MAATVTKDRKMGSIDGLCERVAKAEWEARAMEKTMNAAHEDLRDEIEKLQDATAPKPPPVWRIAGFAFGVLCVLASAIWMFARYPDREEFNAAQQSNMKAHKELETKLGTLSIKQTALTVTIEANQKSTDRTLKSIDSKLGKLVK